MKAGKDRGSEQIDMSGIYFLCWGLLLLTELSSHHLAAEMNASNYIETDSSTTKDADPKGTYFKAVNCTSLDVKVLDMTPMNDSYLYIGSTAEVSVSIGLPVGFIERLQIELTHHGENIDFDNMESYHSGNINCTNTSFVWPRQRLFQTSFQRMGLASYEFYKITTSYSNGTENRLFSKFYVYLHNAKGLQDGQNITIHAYAYQWNGMSLIACPTHELQFTTKTQLLKTNKTAYFAMVKPKTPELISKINLFTKIKFKAWIPDYNPMIKVLLQRFTDSLWITYLRVISIGLSFSTDFADIGLLRVSSCADNTSLLLEFPSHWVNRDEWHHIDVTDVSNDVGYSLFNIGNFHGNIHIVLSIVVHDYYKRSNTTDADVIEFEAGVISTGLGDLESEQNIGISILFHDKEVWNSSVVFTGNSIDENVHAFPLVKMSIVDDLVKGPIVSSTNIPLKLLIARPPNTTGVLNIRLWTGNLLGRGKPAVTVTNVSFGSTDINMTCYDLNVMYNNTGHSLVQNIALIHLKYIASDTGIITGSINLTFEVNIVPEKMNFADTYVVFVATGNVTSEFKIDMTLPEILNDRNNTLLGQFHNLLDGDNNTCMDLPVNGDFPPLFWTRVHTAWFRINASPFEMTLIGKEIACQRNGSKISQVSFTTSSSKNGFHGDLKICTIKYNGDKNRNITKCVYNCQCKNDMECSEVILFMANHEMSTVWKLCELSAVNV